MKNLEIFEIVVVIGGKFEEGCVPSDSQYRYNTMLFDYDKSLEDNSKNSEYCNKSDSHYYYNSTHHGYDGEILEDAI